MKYLLIPENNSLSHIAKCLAIRDVMIKKGHEVHIAVSVQNSGFLKIQGVEYHILSDIQETDSSGFPTFKWFSNTENIVNCIKEEVNLINKIKPDRVLGVFRFTLFAASGITGVPYDSLICGCMIPESEEVLGFFKDEKGINLQKSILDNFFRYAGNKMNIALSKFGLTKIDDIRYALKGEHTFLWDFPEFMPVRMNSGISHVGPIALDHWTYDNIDMDHIYEPGSAPAVVSFGTCITDKDTVQRIVNILRSMDYLVIVAAGGQKEMLDIKGGPGVKVYNFAPLLKIFPHASLLVTHGGQMTVFEALKNKSSRIRYASAA